MPEIHEQLVSHGHETPGLGHRGEEEIACVRTSTLVSRRPRQAGHEWACSASAVCGTSSWPQGAKAQPHRRQSWKEWGACRLLSHRLQLTGSLGGRSSQRLPGGRAGTPMSLCWGCPAGLGGQWQLVCCCALNSGVVFADRKRQREAKLVWTPPGSPPSFLPGGSSALLGHLMT